MSFFEQQQWSVTTLASVHLGTGQDYESTSYVIDDGVMYAVSETALFKALKPNQLKQINDFSEKGERGLVAIQKMLRDHKEQLKQHSEHIIAIGAGVERFYDKRMNEDGKNFNQMFLPKTASELYTGRPFIPGTAIKGAIRTALMNAKLLRDPRLKPDNPKDSQHILKKIHGFNHVNDDPFKTIKVSDAMGAAASLHKKIVLVNSQHWDDAKKSKAARPSLMETIAAGQVNAFKTDLRIWPSEPGHHKVVESLNDLAKQVNAYYLPLLNEELQRNQSAGYYKPDYSKAIQNLVQDQQFNAALSKGTAMILRLGKFSGAVTKTLETLRSIKIKGQKGSPDKYKSLPNEQRLVASSENGSSHCEPLGWVVLTQRGATLSALNACTNAIYAQDEQLQKLADVAATLTEKRQAFLEQTRTKAAAEAETAAAAEQKANQLAAMTESELQIYQLLERVTRGEGKGSGAGHQLWADTKTVISACHAWSDAEKRALLAAAKQIALHMTIDWKKNDKAKAVIRSIGVTE